MLTHDQRKVFKCFCKNEPLNVTQICAMLKINDTDACFKTVRSLYHKKYISVVIDIIDLDCIEINKDNSFVLSAYGETYRQKTAWTITEHIFAIIGGLWIVIQIIDYFCKLINPIIH